MTKLCARGKAAAKRKFKVYPSAYANAYASKICAGKIKDPSGVKRKDFRGELGNGWRFLVTFAISAALYISTLLASWQLMGRPRGPEFDFLQIAARALPSLRRFTEHL